MRTIWLATLTFGTLFSSYSPAQESKNDDPTRPVFLYGHDLRVRTGGSPNFDPKTPTVGVELFQLKNLNALVAISQAGDLAVQPLTNLDANHNGKWLFAHDLNARKADEMKFTPTTKKFGVEVFHDLASGNLLYVCESGTIALAKDAAAAKTDGEPSWHHALLLKVRGIDQSNFDDSSKKFGLEVFKDSNTGKLIYISETGSLAIGTAPQTAPAPDEVKAPQALYGLTVQVRDAEQKNFTDDTKKYSVEVFKDANTGELIYITDTGSIAVAPAPASLKKNGGVTWEQAVVMKARPGGVADFAKGNAYGVELFVDENTGYKLFVSNVGNIAVMTGK